MKTRKLLGIVICGAVLLLLFFRTQTNTAVDVPTERPGMLNLRRLSNSDWNSTISNQFFSTEALCNSSGACAYGLFNLPEELIKHSNEEVRHIGFLKVHKAASSTVQNMFFRFGMTRNLSFVFTNHPNYFSREASRHFPVIRPKYRNGFDILCNHAVFDYSTFSKLLPPDTRYIAIVRDPLDLYISSVNFYSQQSQLLRYISVVPGNKLKNLIRNPRYDREFFSYTKNLMARDFGFPETTDSHRIEHKLRELNSIFSVVLLVEYFGESLILMKRYLNWRLRDIVFIANNVYKENGYSIKDLSPLDVTLFRERNRLDYVVYNFFYERFWRQLEAEPADIRMEVLNFKQVLKQVSTFCSADTLEVHEEKYLKVLETRWNEQFEVTYEDCSFMKEDEQKFIELLRKKQGSELPRRSRG